MYSVLLSQYEYYYLFYNVGIVNSRAQMMCPLLAFIHFFSNAHTASVLLLLLPTHVASKIVIFKNIQC